MMKNAMFGRVGLSFTFYYVVILRSWAKTMIKLERKSALVCSNSMEKTGLPYLMRQKK